jgi:Ca2+-binding EF-hand superfamily protein
MLDKKEIWAAVRRLRIPVKWTEFERMYHAIDLDGSGEVDFEEFSALFTNKEVLNFGGPVPWGE